MEDILGPIYIFVSHSHQDLDKVRVIRNYLEELGGEPILFFLKSLSDEDRIVDLIKHEIDARIWFIYCKSKNAELSKWVRTELEYVALTNKANQLELDLDNDFESNLELKATIKVKIKNSINKIKKMQNFFISYSHKDGILVKKIEQYFERYGINFWYDSDLKAGFNWAEEVSYQIDNSAYYLIFVSKVTFESKFIEMELFKAVNSKKIIILVVLSSPGESVELPSVLKTYRAINFNVKDFEKSALALINDLYKFLELKNEGSYD